MNEAKEIVNHEKIKKKKKNVLGRGTCNKTPR